MPSPTPVSVLTALPKARLAELGRELAVALPVSLTKDQLAERLVRAAGVDLDALTRLLSRDELKQACRAHALDDSGRSRDAFATRLLGRPASDTPTPLFSRAVAAAPTDLPRRGDIVHVRLRQYLVEEVVSAPLLAQATRVRLVCLDDDAQGKTLDVLWELELGARVFRPESHGLGDVEALDPPHHFAAYLHALRWHAVTATDARLLQAPFRAGIELMNHQLTPLKRALELPRANLFIADDVGLGKTIEAGLVLQELLLRQQVETTLIVAPASVCRQWQDEMQKRFGLRFEIYNRTFVARRRRERGFGVNPWTTHTRFIVSYQTLRRSEVQGPLLARLGERARKSLLILDEAHTAAPASASKYAIDSKITHVVRDLAGRFDNRLFLSATPHNGHSNSFSALLELLDPQRFTRGVKVTPSSLSTVMVRRLKSDLRALGDTEHFPERKVIRVDVGSPDAPEVRLSALLAEYAALMRPEKGRGRLTFVTLQKRLLSSIEAFRRTLAAHAQAIAEGRAKTALTLSLADDEDDDPDDDALEEALLAETDADSRLLKSPEGRARELLTQLQALAGQHAGAPDAKVAALLDWIREHQCAGVEAGGAKGRGAALKWSDRRVLIFTEYGDTKRYLANLLRVACEGTHLDEERILELHGGMSEDQREEVQRAFNAPPADHPVRILIATDAAREGVNLQGACADLFHFDIPWNPARMEQRNGRIDRTLQPEKVVRCHYFRYPDRPEDVVLAKLVDKVAVIQEQLGSLSSVILDRYATTLERGIDGRTAAALDTAEEAAHQAKQVKEELEAQRELKRMQVDRDENGRLATSSRKAIAFEPELLRSVVDVGLELAKKPPLAPAQDAGTYVLPDLGDDWQATLDTLRRPRRRDESFWEWRDQAPPEPVVFTTPSRLSAGVVQLHLSHPFVQRILARFRAQGFAAQDLSRVTAIRNPHDDDAVVIAFGRLSLFGPGATRLHDEIVTVAAAWKDAGGRGHLKPLDDKGETAALTTLDRLLRELSPTSKGVSKTIQARLAADAKDDLAVLWPEVKEEAETLATEAGRKLEARARAEATGLTELLTQQRAAIHAALGERRQLSMSFSDAERDQREQWEGDEQHMMKRLGDIDRELETEPAQIRSLYQVALQRLEPVGLVYLWPGTRG